MVTGAHQNGRHRILIDPEPDMPTVLASTPTPAAADRLAHQLTDRTALVLGASGGIGGEVARQLRAAGWHVRGMKRGLAADRVGPDAEGIEWVPGDAMVPADVRAAAEGCAVLVHAVNPPGYRHWSTTVLPMVDATIAAACETGATIVLPGTVYNFGPDAFPLLREDDPQRPVTRKGAIRVEMERRLEAATARGARVIVVRAGDFFGPSSANTWFAQGLVSPGRPVRRVLVPNDRAIGHQWAYLPDVARTMVALLERRATLPAFARFHLGGHWDADGTRIAEAVRRVVARRTGRAPRLLSFPWWLVTLASPFVTTFREMREMRYLWRTPVRLDGARLDATLAGAPHTPLDEAIEATLEALGCLPRTGRAAGASTPTAAPAA
jgi:nucleoside-diphosphate-sugar epimerase